MTLWHWILYGFGVMWFLVGIAGLSNGDGTGGWGMVLVGVLVIASGWMVHRRVRQAKREAQL
jgi:high-affinity Fe2+/Pb2+ permease